MYPAEQGQEMLRDAGETGSLQSAEGIIPAYQLKVLHST
jgi:hypothetical protein